MSNGPEFFQTRMGQEFYEGTMKRIARSLEKLANVATPRQEAAATPKPTPAHIYRVMELSTAHIEEKASKALEDHDLDGGLYVRLFNLFDNEFQGGLAIDSKDGGYFVSIPDTPLDKTPHCSPEYEDLVSIITVAKYAQSQGCRWLVLDQDAGTISDLPTYDW